jgi:hypothetical protein
MLATGTDSELSLGTRCKRASENEREGQGTGQRLRVSSTTLKTIRKKRKRRSREIVVGEKQNSNKGFLADRLLHLYIVVCDCAK